jgi:FixJ family two-component response regulator
MPHPDRPTPQHVRRANTLARNERMRQRMAELHDRQRIRMDDVIQRIADEFNLSPVTVERILFNRQ